MTTQAPTRRPTWPFWAFGAVAVLAWLALTFGGERRVLSSDKGPEANAQPAEANVELVDGVACPPLDLPSAEAQTVRGLQQELGRAPTPQAKADALDRLVAALRNSNRPDMAALLLDANTPADNLPAALPLALTLADGRQYLLRQGAADAAEALRTRAVARYTTWVEANPKDLDAQTQLGVLEVEGMPPMKGIRRLLDVVEQDPNHYAANVALGAFAIRSGQLDKAEPRFKNALARNAQGAEALYHFGRLRQAQGQLNEARALWREALSNSQDPALTQTLRQLLNQPN